MQIGILIVVDRHSVTHMKEHHLAMFCSTSQHIVAMNFYLFVGRLLHMDLQLNQQPINL